MTDACRMSVIIVAAVALFIHFNVKVQFLDSAEYRAMAEEYLTNRRTVNSLFSFVWPHGNGQQPPPPPLQAQQQQSNQQAQLEAAVQLQSQSQDGTQAVEQPQPLETPPMASAAHQPADQQA